MTRPKLQTISMFPGLEREWRGSDTASQIFEGTRQHGRWTQFQYVSVFSLRDPILSCGRFLGWERGGEVRGPVSGRPAVDTPPPGLLPTTVPRLSTGAHLLLLVLLPAHFSLIDWHALCVSSCRLLRRAFACIASGGAQATPCLCQLQAIAWHCLVGSSLVEL
jgi:hypothetical protein